MQRVTAWMAMLAVVALTATEGHAQTKPTFAGEWKKTTAPGGGQPGVDLAITQNATTMTVRDRAAGPETLTYHLDGSSSRNTVAPRGGGAPAARISTATWKDRTLIVKTTTGAGVATQTFSLSGGDLVVETSGPGRGDAPTKTTYTRYVRGYGG